MLNLGFQQLGQVVHILDVIVLLGQLGVRHGHDLGIFARFVGHLQHANRTAANDGAGQQRVGSRHQHVDGIPVQGQGGVHVTVVARVEHRGGHEAINEDGTAVLVDFVFDRVGILRDFDDDVDVVRQALASRYQVQAHDVSFECWSQVCRPTL